MSDDVRDIPPALDADRWREISGRHALEGALADAAFVTRDVTGLAATIALANAALADEDPRKLTRATVGLLRQIGHTIENLVGTTFVSAETKRAEIDAVRDLADVIESYLPPDPSIDRTPFKNENRFMGFPVEDVFSHPPAEDPDFRDNR
jgi:hypothetical protein